MISGICQIDDGTDEYQEYQTLTNTVTAGLLLILSIAYLII